MDILQLQFTYRIDCLHINSLDYYWIIYRRVILHIRVIMANNINNIDELHPYFGEHIGISQYCRWDIDHLKDNNEKHDQFWFRL